jgi:hypothetical protein
VASGTEWTVIVETPPGVARDVHLGPFLRALLANAGAIAPAASFDAGNGVLAAQFQVFADDRDDAALRGCFAYWGAVAAAGVISRSASTLLVAPVDDAGDAQRFIAVAQLEPAGPRRL